MKLIFVPIFFHTTMAEALGLALAFIILVVVTVLWEASVTIPRQIIDAAQNFSETEKRRLEENKADMIRYLKK